MRFAHRYPNFGNDIYIWARIVDAQWILKCGERNQIFHISLNIPAGEVVLQTHMGLGQSTCVVFAASEINKLKRAFVGIVDDYFKSFFSCRNT